MRRRFALVVATAILFSGGIAYAGLGRAPADKAAVAPLRDLDLGACLDGRAEPLAAIEAGRRLPSRCGAASGAASCDDDLRCAWLAARARAADSCASSDRSARLRAADALDRAADRLARSDACGSSEEERARWIADRHAAFADAARFRLALLTALRGVPGPLPADDPVASRLARVVARARRGGSGAVSDDTLAPLRDALRRTERRARWLAGQPAVARVRALVHEAWAPYGGVPDGCGGELLRGHLLADEWRGLIVREAVPRAMACLSGRYGLVVSRDGARLADPDRAAALAASLAARAASDDGGRRFGLDRQILGEVDALASAIAVKPTERAEFRRPQPRPANAIPPTAPPQPSGVQDAREKRPVPARAAERSQSSRPVQPARGARPRATARETRDAGGIAHGDLVALASRAAGLLGHDPGLRASAARASTPAEHARVLARIHVAVHHELCAPLERLDPGDRDAAFQVLDRAGVDVDERACAQRDESRAARRLLDGAAGLVRLRAAAELRRAARQVASGHHDDALRTVDALPDSARGTTWALVRAWALRRKGDHAEAARTLSLLDESLVDRLRTAGDEALARLVAHAFVAPQN